MYSEKNACVVWDNEEAQQIILDKRLKGYKPRKVLLVVW